MMKISETLAKQLSNCANDPGWFVPIDRALKGLTEEQAAYKQGTYSNSIWEIVNHLLYYNQLYLNRFMDEPNMVENISNEETFEYDQDRNWEKTVEAINTLMLEWPHAVRTATDEQMKRWDKDLAQLTIHTAYHIGQIVTLRKQADNWDPTNGIPS